MRNFRKTLIAAAATAALFVTGQAQSAELLNVSYDPTRELYKQVNAAFAAEWKAKTGETVTIKQSHGGSGKQARSVIDGLDADVVTLALAGDIDAIAKQAKLLPANWQSRLADNSSPYYSTQVFLVRKGNPWKIKNWYDLVKPGVQIIVPNPKTSGGARWLYLAAWGAVEKAPGGNQEKAKAYIKSFYQHVPVLDTGARGATTTFTERGIGDVLVTWENEAYLAQQEQPGAFDIVYPPVSILAEPTVAIVDKNVDRKKTRKVAEAYLQFLYSKKGQEIAAKNSYRVRDETILKSNPNFKPISLFTINDPIFGGWAKVDQVHFKDGGVFDQIYKK